MRPASHRFKCPWLGARAIGFFNTETAARRPPRLPLAEIDKMLGRVRQQSLRLGAGEIGVASQVVARIDQRLGGQSCCEIASLTVMGSSACQPPRRDGLPHVGIADEIPRLLDSDAVQ